MSANNLPMFTRLGALTSGITLLTGVTDYNGINIETREVFSSDDTNGKFIERLRCKALGTNVQTVLRVFINQGGINTQFAGAPSAPTGTPSTSGGTLQTGSYFAKIIAIGPNGSQSALGTASASVSVTGPTGSIAWAWTAVPGAASYEIWVGPTATQQARFFTSVTNSFSQTAPYETGTNGEPTSGNTGLYQEFTLPATTAITNAATYDFDCMLNLTLSPGAEIYASLGTTVAAGWHIIPIGGVY
jgi:hypothetical protein